VATETKATTRVKAVSPTVVYTDGACSGNPGPGGWGWIVPDGPWANGFDAATTNQRMELMAVLEALRTLEGPVEVVSDSTYVVNCFLQRWWVGWLKRGWKNANKQPVANRDLWEPLLDLYQARAEELTFRWIKGHSGDPNNDLADQLAVDAVLRQGGRHGVGTPDDLGDGDTVRPTKNRDAATLAANPAVVLPGPDGRYSSAWAPTGPAVLVTGVQPPLLGGYDPNPIADAVRAQLVTILSAKAEVAPDLVVLTGLRLGAETLAAEAAAEAELPFVAVLPYPDAQLAWPAVAQRRFAELINEAVAVVQLERKLPSDARAAGQALDRRNGWLRRVATEAVVVWDHHEPRIGKVVQSLETAMPDDVWIVSP
jgi:ribonuclease HI